MWSDTLLLFERGHVLRIFMWSTASVLAGTLLLAYLIWRREPATLLRHFAIQTTTLGAVEFACCLWFWQGLAFRDYAALQRLVNSLWFQVGLYVGLVAVGATLAISAWRFGRRASGVGAGVGIIVQGLALLLLSARLIGTIGPLR